MKSTFYKTSENISFISNYLQYIVMFFIILLFLILKFLGSSFELIWSLVNTLQLISYLPLMILFYPEHVVSMFNYLKFTNMNIDFLSDLFKSLIPFDLSDAPSFNTRFTDFGIKTSIFVDNWASLLLSLLASVMILTLCSLLIGIVCCDKLRNLLNRVISSYFYNNFIRFVTEGYLNLCFNGLLNVVAFNHSSVSEVVSLCIAMLATVVCIVFPCITAAQLYDKRKQIKGEHEIYLKRFGTIFRDFKTDKEWYHFQYYPFFMFRRLIFSVMLILLINYDQVQSNSFILFSILVWLCTNIL